MRPCVLPILVTLAALIVWPAVGLGDQSGRVVNPDDPATFLVAPAPASTPATAIAPATWPAAPAGARQTREGWFAPPTPGQATSLPKEVTRVFVIPIREEITTKTFEAFSRKVERCRKGGAQIVILDMDTWGGEVIAGLDIARMIKVDLGDVYTVCYVRTRGISAGSLIGMACNEIVMTPVGTFGDCAPISRGGELTGVMREKIETELRTEFRESAKRNGYNLALSQGMVTADLEVWLIRNKKTSELQYVLANDWNARVTVPPGVTSAPSNPDAEWEVLRVAKPPGRLLTMTSDEAVDNGFVKNLVAPTLTDAYGELMKRYGVSEPPTVLEDTWSESLVEILTSPTVMGILFFLGIFLAYMEINAPGHIVPGVLAALCFAIIFFSHYLIGMSDWWQIALFVVGIALVVVELVTFHTAGILLLVGVLCCVAGLVGILVPHMPGTLPVPQSDMDWNIFKSGLLALGMGFIGAVVAAMLFAKYLPHLPIAGKLVLPSITVPSEPPVSPAAPLKEIQVGDIGVAETLCRPVGKVRFGQLLLNATSTGDIIEPGTRVKVLRRDENRIIVEKA